MANMTYGTVEFYAEQFADILADIDHSDPAYGDAIVEGFILAIDNWRDYYAKQVDEYDRVEQRVRQALTV
jgi:hypothetical protein